MRMLQRLPFQTIGDVAQHGLKLHIYCPGCRTSRRLDVSDPSIAHRGFGTTRFRCTGIRPLSGQVCGAHGVPKIQPAEILRVGGPVTLAFLWCDTCLWEIDQARLDKPPWSGSGQRYRCPGCGGAVRWDISGPSWGPARAYGAFVATIHD